MKIIYFIGLTNELNDNTVNMSFSNMIIEYNEPYREFSKKKQEKKKNYVLLINSIIKIIDYR